MDRFEGNFTLRLDAKQRVPSPLLPFGSHAMASTAFTATRRSPPGDRRRRECADGGDRGPDRSLRPVPRGARAFALSLYGTSETLNIDGEGRVVSSESLKRHAGITEAAFVGLDHKFQIWSRAGSKRARGGHPKVRALKSRARFPGAARNALGAWE